MTDEIIRWWVRTTFSAIIILTVSGCAQYLTKSAMHPETMILRMNIDGHPTPVVTRVYKPEGDGPFPLVIFSHGRDSPSVRAALKYPILTGHVDYWLRKGVAVLAPIRPGYGATGGPDREATPVGKLHNGSCTGTPNYTLVADRARSVVVEIHDWAIKQPWVRPDRILLEGQSVGGLTSVAAGALNLSGVIGVVNFSGGDGGSAENSPRKSCDPEQLTNDYYAYGKEAKIPSIWFYAKNDLLWGSAYPVIWFDSYREGGSDTTLIDTLPVDGHNGHFLLNYGGTMWSKPLDNFIQKIGFLSH